MAKENDVVLIYLEDQPISFARIESISPDVKKDSGRNLDLAGCLY